MEALIDIVLLAFMAMTVIAIVVSRNLFAVVALGGIYSLLAATVFMLLDAVDVAFTEAAVGAGVSTVLFIGTLALTTRTEAPPRHSRIIPLITVIITGAALVYGTSDLARFGDPQSPVHTHVGPEYLQRSIQETTVPNVVTSVLASYRGYDTLGETVVVFTAGIGVILLLGSWRRERRKKE